MGKGSLFQLSDYLGGDVWRKRPSPRTRAQNNTEQILEGHSSC